MIDEALMEIFCNHIDALHYDISKDNWSDKYQFFYLNLAQDDQLMYDIGEMSFFILLTSIQGRVEEIKT